MADPRYRSGVNPERDPICSAAADWVGRLSNANVSLEDTLVWQAWMKADVRHAEAFCRFEQISQSLKVMEPPPAPRNGQLARDGYDGSMPLSEWLHESTPAALLGNGKIWATAAAIVLAVGATLWVMTVSNGNRFSKGVSIAATQIGENRSVRLSDGSTVVLGGATRLQWFYSEDERALELLQGEALFKVAKDLARPFKVRAGDATVVALGTEFNVRRVSDHTVVAVTDGRVVVEPATRLLPVAVLREFRPKLRRVEVDAGEQTTAGSTGIEVASRVEDPAATTSWRTGRLSFRLQPLRYALEDVNRYVKKPIVAVDEEIGSLVVSGTVIGDNVEGWVESLEHAFGLSATEEDGRVVLRRR